jgi:hypothetical protein
MAFPNVGLCRLGVSKSWELHSPAAEQHHILAKANELTGRCDRLEGRRTAARAKSRRVCGAVLHDALKLAAQGEHAGKTDEGRMVQSRVLRRPASSRIVPIVTLAGVMSPT